MTRLLWYYGCIDESTGSGISVLKGVAGSEEVVGRENYSKAMVTYQREKLVTVFLVNEDEVFISNPESRKGAKSLKYSARSTLDTQHHV